MKCAEHSRRTLQRAPSLKYRGALHTSKPAPYLNYRGIWERPRGRLERAPSLKYRDTDPTPQSQFGANTAQLGANTDPTPPPFFHWGGLPGSGEPAREHAARVSRELDPSLKHGGRRPRCRSNCQKLLEIGARALR